MAKKKEHKTELSILEEINNKLSILILLNSLLGKTESEKVIFLKNIDKSGFSKRELERITGIDRHKF